MFEKPKNPENKSERIPSEQEVRFCFEKLTGGEAYEEVRKKEDEKGVYLWEIKMTEATPDGGSVEYSYGREGSYPENKSVETAIHVAYFDANGVPEGGHSVLKYIEGNWVETP